MKTANSLDVSLECQAAWSLNSQHSCSCCTLTDWHDKVEQTCMSESPKSYSRIRDLVHTSLRPTFDLVRGGQALGKDQLGRPDLDSPAGSRVVSRGSAEQSTLDNQGGGAGT